MDLWLIFLNGFLISASASFVIFIYIQARHIGAKKEDLIKDLRELLKTIETSHNTLTEAQIDSDRRLRELGLELVGIQERLRIKSTF